MRHITNLVAHLANVTRSQDRNFALSRLSQTSKRSQQRGLPGSVVAEDGIQPARSKACTHASQSCETSELLDEIGDTYDGLRGADGIGVGQGQWGKLRIALGRDFLV